VQPLRVVASHKNPALDDDPKAIAETRRHLEAVERVSQNTHSALEFYDAMIELYPERLNPTAPWSWGARVLFPATVGALAVASWCDFQAADCVIVDREAIPQVHRPTREVAFQMHSGRVLPVAGGRQFDHIGGVLE
jgi:hypothetical protein